MKILYISPYPPARDGIGTYTGHLAGAIRDQGHDIRVIVPRSTGKQPDEVIGSLGSPVAGPGGVARAIRHWGPDIVHVQFAVAAFGTRTPLVPRWLRLLRRQPGLPAVVATLHEVTREAAMLRGPGRSFYRVLTGQCERVIVHTETALAEVTQRIGVPPKKTSVIPHPDVQPSLAGVSAGELRSRFALGTATVLLAFGFIHVDKGLDDLVQALAMLRHSGVPLVDVRLVIAGAVRRRHGPFRALEARDHVHFARILRLARQLGLRQQLALTGYVPEQEIAGWFQTADAVLLPYRRTEQSGVAGLANAFRVPVIASTAGGLGEQFRDIPWTFPPRDLPRFAGVLGEFLSATPEQRAEVVRKRQVIDVRAAAAATLDVYAAVRAASRRPCDAA